MEGKKEGMPCSGREGSKVNSVVYKPLHVAISNSHMGKNRGGGAHYMCTPRLAPNPKRKSLIEKEKDLAFSQEGSAMQGEAQYTWNKTEIKLKD